jgi:hypothetical protein
MVSVGRWNGGPGDASNPNYSVRASRAIPLSDARPRPLHPSRPSLLAIPPRRPTSPSHLVVRGSASSSPVKIIRHPPPPPPPPHFASPVINRQVFARQLFTTVESATSLCSRLHFHAQSHSSNGTSALSRSSA